MSYTLPEHKVVKKATEIEKRPNNINNSNYLQHWNQASQQRKRKKLFRLDKSVLLEQPYDGFLQIL